MIAGAIVFAVLVLVALLVVLTVIYDQTKAAKLQLPKRVERELEAKTPKFMVLLSRKFVSDDEKIYNYLFFKLSTGDDDAVMTGSQGRPEVFFEFDFFGIREQVRTMPVLSVSFITEWLKGNDQENTIARCLKANIPLEAVFFTQKSCALLFAQRFGGALLSLSGNCKFETPLRLNERHTKKFLEDSI